MSITNRYLSAEILKSSVSTMLILFVILMSNAFSGILSDISLGEVPQQALLPLLISQASALMSLLIPFGFFLGVVFAFGRLYKDYELPVLNSCGFGYRDMFKPVLMVIAPLLLLNTYFSLSLNATALSYAQQIVDDGDGKGEFENFKPGRFNVSKNGEHVFYMEKMSPDHSHLENLIINQSANKMVSIEIAEKGVQIKDKKTQDLFLEVGPGVRYEGFPGEADFKVMNFATHGILLEKQEDKKRRSIKSKEKPLMLLLESNNKKDNIELQWRLAVPMMLVVLGMLAVPLSYIAPRKGRYGKMGVAIVVYIVYNNSLGAVLAAMEKGTLSINLGFWLVHAVFLMIALALTFYRNRGVFHLRVH